MKKGFFWRRVAAAAMCMAAAWSLTAFADSTVRSRENKLAQEQRKFPFEVVLSEETCERKCYAGFGKKYANGYAITPYTEFEIRSADPSADAANLRIDIDVVYQSGDSGSKTDKVLTYETGDITADDGSTYAFFTERNLENLEERGNLYSDSQKSLRMTLTYEAGGNKTEKRYYQVCEDEDLAYYLESADAAEMAEPEPAPAVIYNN